MTKESPNNPMVPEIYTITRVRKETADTFTIDLKPKQQNGDIIFSAGQFNMLYVFGTGEVPISISGDPTNSHVYIHTIRAVGAVTNALQKMKLHDSVGVRGPFGTHWPVDESEGYDILIVAGGIGLAPLRPVLYHVLSKREKFGRIIVLYGARTPSDILYKKELEHWRGRFDIDVEVIVDSAPATWRGNVGVVTKLIQKARFDADSTVAMMCGPGIMMRYTIQELTGRGVPEKNLFVSMERNMKCGIGLCGHCQLGPTFICKDGPVFCYSNIKNMFEKRGL